MEGLVTVCSCWRNNNAGPFHNNFCEPRGSSASPGVWKLWDPRWPGGNSIGNTGAVASLSLILTSWSPEVMVIINPFWQMGDGGPGAKQHTHSHLEGRQSHDPTDRDGKAERATVFLKARLRTAHNLVHSNCHRQRPVTAKPTVTITRTPNPQGLSSTTEDLQQQVTTTNSRAPCEDVQTQVLYLSSGPLSQDS